MMLHVRTIEEAVGDVLGVKPALKATTKTIGISGLMRNPPVNATEIV